MNVMDWEQRANEFARLYEGGLTFQEIGHKFGISRQAVQAAVSKRHPEIVGGVALRKAKRLRSVADARDKRYLEKCGCTWSQYKAIDPSIRKAFGEQARNARHRGIAWKMKFWDWFTVWRRSGVLDKRGRYAGQYVMCRVGDQGAYEVGNVYIATTSHNLSSAQMRKWHGQDMVFA